MRHDHRVYFASEIKALLEVPGWKPELNSKVLAYYLSHYQPIMGSETLFQGIYSVEPGTVLTFQGVTSDRQEECESPRVARYWSFPVVPNDRREDRGEGYYAAKVRDLLSRAVERQSVSDVPLGAYLSGGLDSTILVGLLQQLSDRQIRTYSIGFDDSPCNEFPYSQLAAKLFNTNHTEIGMSVEDYFPAMEELIRYKDAPLSVPNEVPLFLMSKILKDDITVVLSGEGADELFAGYAPILRTPYDFKNVMQKDGAERREFLHKLSSFYSTLDFDDELSHFRAAYCWLAPEELRRLLKPAYQHSEDHDPIAEYWAQKFQPLEQMLPVDRLLHILETVHLSGLLARLDTTTMAASVEGRVPFTDTELLEFVAGIPLEYKLRWKSPEHAKLAEGAHCLEIAENLDVPKYILKKSFQDMVPLPIIERRKLAFPVPLDQWFQDSHLDYVRNTIHESKIMPEVFDLQEVDRLIYKNDTPNYSVKVWMLLNVSIWLETYFT
jgi:asparagine synthase (glutamine-hydrolysing)